MEQNSEKWKEWRRAGIGASDSPVIMGVSPWTTPYQLWQEKLGLLVREETNKYILDKGHREEPKARALYELRESGDFPPVLAEHTTYPWLRASLDGFNSETKVAIEIKLAGKDDHVEVEKGNIPEKYFPQVQHQLFVTGAIRVDYISYNEGSIHVVPVYPDMNYINKKWFPKVLKFWEQIQNKNEPDLTDKDYVKVKDENLILLLEQYADLIREIDESEKKREELKQVILASCSGNCKHEKIKVATRTRKGNVDYSSIPALENIDLEPYRKPPVSYREIRISK